MAAADYYIVYDIVGNKLEELWKVRNHDYSSAMTGSSVFDFNGDGRAEVLYADESNFMILRGSDGTVLNIIPNCSATLWENPIIVDIDNDDMAEVIIAANNYGNCGGTFPTGTSPYTGIRIFGSANIDCIWEDAREIWNQHSYNIVNINTDGTIPSPMERNWEYPLGNPYNNYRQNIAD